MGSQQPTNVAVTVSVMEEKTAPPPYADGYGAPPPQQGFVAPPQQGGYAPPPQQGYGMSGYSGPPPLVQQQQPGSNAAVVVASGMINFGHDPVRITCPHCQKQVQTRTKSNTSAIGWGIGIALCCIGCWPCAFIP